MADISAIFFILLIIGIAYPALLTAWWLLFPATVEGARLRLEHTPWQSFWLGGVMLALFLIPTIILLSLPFGPAKFIGWTMIVFLLTFSGLGAAGLAARLGERVSRLSAASGLAAFIRGAVILELASFFPVIGWFIFFPLATVATLGAAAFALVRWLPRPAPAVEPVPAQA